MGKGERFGKFPPPQRHVLSTDFPSPLYILNGILPISSRQGGQVRGPPPNSLHNADTHSSQQQGRARGGETVSDVSADKVTWFPNSARALSDTALPSRAAAPWEPGGASGTEDSRSNLHRAVWGQVVTAGHLTLWASAHCHSLQDLTDARGGLSQEC